MKLRALFSVILLNTNGDTGISTGDLALTLWPYKDVDGSKNTRGVTVKRLRTILDDIDGISLVQQKHQWYFVFDEPFYCDWLEYSNIMQALHAATNQEQYNALMEQLIAIVRNGIFLVNVQDVGIDDYKSKEEEKLEQLLGEYMARLYEDKQYQKIILNASTFFAFDPLNEKMLDICIKAYNKLGKKDEAKAFFKNYKRTYKMLTGEQYEESGSFRV
jgi:two-component SAPR family response regulator